MRKSLACDNWMGVATPRGIYPLVVLAVACAFGCVASPRSESNLSRKHDPLSFSGLFEAPDADLDVQAFSYEKQTWVRFATLRTRAPNPVIDAQGRPYFRYAANLVLPQGREYWSPHVDAGRIEARTRVVFGDRVLSVFGENAESCVRAAHARGMSESAALEHCENKENTYSRVFVAACGDAGEACCKRSDGQKQCSAAFLCQAGVCEAPSYAAPIIADHQVDLSVPAEYVLRDAWLVLDDTSGKGDTERVLVSSFRASDGVRRARPHPSVERLTFDLPLWKPGVNRYHVRGYATRGGARRLVESSVFQVDYEVPRALGQVAPGVLRLPQPHFARTMRECHGVVCKDRDGDGLSDLWENVALHQLRPRLMLDRDDGLFRRKKDVVSVLSSVKPITRGGQDYVLFASVVAFSWDYGHMNGFYHPGDTEAFGMLFRVDANDELRWVASAAKGHRCLTCEPTFRWNTQDFAEDGTPLLYVERDKHGLWQNGRECRAKAAFRCRGDRSLRPDAVNVGDSSKDGPRMLVDALDGLAADGPFAALSNLFPGEAVWTNSRARVKGRFCGGIRGCTKDGSASMPGAVIAKLVTLFEKSPW